MLFLNIYHLLLYSMVVFFVEKNQIKMLKQSDTRLDEAPPTPGRGAVLLYTCAVPRRSVGRWQKFKQPTAQAVIIVLTITQVAVSLQQAFNGSSMLYSRQIQFS